ncbi:MAG TPA: hypothetical protein VM536_02775 [Chloroflexia bacterium]|nr:hypothetical protein [Chloroflexia bacterium]
METSSPHLDPDLYRRLLVDNHDAFAAGLYEVAYHALAAALHWADTARDANRLHEIQNQAHAQRAWIVANAPTHRISPQAAALRGNRSVYDSLDLQIQAMLNRATGDEARAE